MKPKQPSSESEKQTGRHKLSVDFNLEKESLQTGLKAPRTTLREKLAMGSPQFNVRWLTILFWFVPILIVAGMTVWLFSGAMNHYTSRFLD